MIGAANASVLPVPVSRARHDVVPFERQRDHRALYRPRAFKAERMKSRLEPRIEPHRIECNRRRVDRSVSHGKSGAGVDGRAENGLAGPRRPPPAAGPAPAGTAL